MSDRLKEGHTIIGAGVVGSLCYKKMDPKWWQKTT